MPCDLLYQSSSCPHSVWPHVCYPKPLTRYCTVLPPSPPPCHPLSLGQKLRDECLRGAKYLSRLLEGLGAEVKMSQCVEGKNPVVLGRLGNNPAHPTVVFYGHYDVQPAEEPDWRTAPWTLCAVDGYLCGRGTSDNKGPILAFVYAIKVCVGCVGGRGSGVVSWDAGL